MAVYGRSIDIDKYLRSESLPKFLMKISSKPELHATVLIISGASLGAWSEIFTELCIRLMVCLNNLNNRSIQNFHSQTIRDCFQGYKGPQGGLHLLTCYILVK